MLLSVHLKHIPRACTVLAEVAEQQGNLAVLRLKRLFTQVAIADHVDCILVEVTSTGVRKIVLLQVLPSCGWPDNLWLLWLAEQAINKAMCGTRVSQKVIHRRADGLAVAEAIREVL